MELALIIDIYIQRTKNQRIGNKIKENQNPLNPNKSKNSHCLQKDNASFKNYALIKYKYNCISI